MKIKYCLRCGKILEGRKLKYCNDTCKYFYKAARTPTKYRNNTAQQLRMDRAARGQSRRTQNGGARYY